jgi:hypothetical protein
MRKLIVLAGAMLVAVLQPAFALAETCVDTPVYTYEIVKVDGGVRVITHASGFCNPWSAIAAGLLKGIEKQRTLATPAAVMPNVSGIAPPASVQISADTTVAGKAK